MKKFLAVVMVAVVSILVTAGCGEVKTYTEFDEAISLRVNQEVIIALGSDPTTGYIWEASYDQTMVELVDKTYEPGVGAAPGTAGGTDYFRFKALKKGETKITMVYKQPGADSAAPEITQEFNFSIR
jgi:predicted secreted protein